MAFLVFTLLLHEARAIIAPNTSLATVPTAYFGGNYARRGDANIEMVGLAFPPTDHAVCASTHKHLPAHNKYNPARQNAHNNDRKVGGPMLARVPRQWHRITWLSIFMRC